MSCGGGIRFRRGRGRTGPTTMEPKKEENSPDPQNRALSDILKIVSVFLPSVGKDGQLLCTDIPDRLKTTFFAGDGTLKMHKILLS